MIIYIHVISVIISKTLLAQGRGLEESIEHEVAVARIVLKGKKGLGQHIKMVDPAFSALARIGLKGKNDLGQHI